MAFAIVFWAVMTMMSVSMLGLADRARTSRPLMSGMRMSTMATSNGAAAERGERLAAGVDGDDRVAACASARRGTQRIDSSSSATRMRAISSRPRRPASPPAGSPGSASTVRARSRREGAAVLGHEAVADREAEAGALVLGGEERGEDALVVLGRCRARVLDVDREVLPAAARAACGRGSRSPCGCDGERAARSMASSAFFTRLRKTWRICASSAQTSGKLGSNWQRMAQRVGGAGARATAPPAGRGGR